ncbi:hypothetical protein Q8A67_001882 [Cirrhinus molitorella]|uniref:C-type lectin domain-containing protein n=1 Tax=Cirrhinus molitorella TaxID=172907 RepID=A0AA88Q2N8_9TELE|nr:hypothetical protein Q8A67_001882 [Cirrhinus molitorella]
MNLNPCIVEENHSAILHKKGRRQRWSFFNKDSSSASAKITIYSFSHTFFTESFEVLDLILMTQERTWEEALEYCRQNNNDLAILNSNEAMTEAKDTSAAALTDDVWIGLRFIAGRWVWVNGEEFQYNGWSSSGELQCPAMNQRCAVLNRMVWKPMDFFSGLDFREIPKAHFCGNGAEVFELILVQKENTWIEALEHCRQNHVDLAGLTSDLMMREAKNKSAPAHADDVWIGLRFIAGHWFWVDRSNVEYNGWWLEGEPQCPPVDQRCGVFDKNKTVWKPDNCERRLNFLCLKKYKVI